MFDTDQSTRDETLSRSHSTTRVSFLHKFLPRSKSICPAPQYQFHPEYTGKPYQQPTHSWSTGSSLDVDILAELMDHHSESQAMMAVAIKDLATAGSSHG